MENEKNLTRDEILDNILKEDEIMDLSKTSFDKAVDVYRKYVGTAETPEERAKRIRRFRCGGRY